MVSAAGKNSVDVFNFEVEELEQYEVSYKKALLLLGNYLEIQKSKIIKKTKANKKVTPVSKKKVLTKKVNSKKNKKVIPK